MATENWFDLQRASLQLLQMLVRERAAGEKNLTEGYAAAVDAAEKEVAKSRRVLGSSKARALGEQAAERAAAEAQMQSTHDDVRSRRRLTTARRGPGRSNRIGPRKRSSRTKPKNAIGQSIRSTKRARSKRRS